MILWQIKSGDISYNSFGSMMIIKEYRTKKDIDIYFPEYNWTFYNSRIEHFEKGNVKCPYEPRIYNKGYFGEGIYNAKDNEKIYRTWHGMLERCYDDKCHKKYPTYIGCEVCDEWLNFQNFAKWGHENYYKIEGERMHLDKDILIKGNKIYSPDTCVFVPQNINKLFTKNNRRRGDLPIGVSTHRDKYSSVCYKMYLGYFNNPHEAFLIYKINKELVIESVANEYKDEIPKQLYEAMINYKVEEND